MDRHEHSRLVTLGANLAALAEAGGLAAIAAGSLTGALARALLGGRGGGHGDRCGCEVCYAPPIHRCGGC